MDPQELVTRGRPESPPPSQGDVTSKAGELGAARGDSAPEFRFSRDFASLEEFLAFARTEATGPGASLPLVDSSLSASELDLAAQEEAVRAQEKLQTAEDVMLMVREARVAEQEGVLGRLSDLEDSERVYIATIEELQDRITLDEERLVQGLESMDNWTRGKLEHIPWEKTWGIASHNKLISWLQGSLDEVHTRGDQAKADFYRARDEKTQLEGIVASLREEMASKKTELITL